MGQLNVSRIGIRVVLTLPHHCHRILSRCSCYYLSLPTELPSRSVSHILRGPGGELFGQLLFPIMRQNFVLLISSEFDFEQRHFIDSEAEPRSLGLLLLYLHSNELN